MATFSPLVERAGGSPNFCRPRRQTRAPHYFVLAPVLPADSTKLLRKQLQGSQQLPISWSRVSYIAIQYVIYFKKTSDDIGIGTVIIQAHDYLLLSGCPNPYTDRRHQSGCP